MNKVLLVGILIGILVGVAFGPKISEAIYSIPPTNAYKTVSIANNVNFSKSTQTNVTAINYYDDYWLVTDGSVLLNVTHYP